MDFQDLPKDIAFRDEIRSFLAEELPAEIGNRAPEWGLFNTATLQTASFREFLKSWTAKLNARGWGAPHWPREYGGGGLTVREQFILNEELAWARAPRSGGIGHGWVAPTIMTYGTPEQKSEYLPKILSGEHRWCQLFSEPGAGSDLASLQARAVQDGDDYVVTGQKIW
ncbi:MAG TPA: acyl-CoA dehydrogenase family protein, partial [Dehalococcoidia bacterium]|nr:acyl-CoA dehydrogenase family protein [Dehalococcoidia bacterium]